MDISIVVPLYNEVESLGELVEKIADVADAHGYSYEVIMVDDGSKDGSWQKIKELSESYPQVRGIKFGRNYGKSPALHMGFQAAQGDVVITMDADLQDNPEEIPGLYRMIQEEGYDLVSGWKKKRYDPPSKTIPTKLFNAVTRKVTGIHLHDFNCGLKAYRLDVVKSIEVYGEMHRYIPVLAKYAGYGHIGEKEVVHQARPYGVSKFGGLNRFVNGFLDLITLVFTRKYVKRPMHFFGTWGVIFALIGGINLFYLAFIRLVQNIWISDRLPALIFGAVAFLSGILLFTVGLLGELIVRNSSGRNNYHVSQRLGFDHQEQMHRSS
ncbi:glycosyltransferase family 2 protein [Pontibacter sp. G13]|uniref:glycosyltransferase family 2 protein n=1 Tax=Pontibacter sp. G13 TaxID=3074898 RepID=UPI00288A56A7|nr:glycosyltransferase family 2 protein [Pontibacter sp. G13]WNJ18204.1 glycosyltransferase family 2 protein [Pontibacter sp. G13]